LSHRSFWDAAPRAQALETGFFDGIAARNTIDSALRAKKDAKVIPASDIAPDSTLK
jgi:uncharacterized protein YdeI (BOF family)